MARGFKRGDKVSALVYDGGTTIAPAIVLGPDRERPHRVRVLVRMWSTGFEVRDFDAGSRDYLDFPLPTTAERWADYYAELEREANKHY